MNRITAATLFAALIFCGTAAAEDVKATVVKITGKAQLLKGTEWAALSIGETLGAGATVSTGFRSELLLKIGPSTVTVKALSRLTVQDLVASGSELKTDLYLKVGKIEAEVNKSEAVTASKFTVSSPVATASVRGTVFRFDGIKLQVLRGLVDFSDARGNLVRVPVGEQARAAYPGTSQGLSNNQNEVTQDSTTVKGTNIDESGSISGYDSTDILSQLNSYDWASEIPTVEVYIGGIYQ